MRGSTSLVRMVAEGDSSGRGSRGTGGRNPEWLTGPGLPEGVHQGQHLGLPASGPGAVASMLRRVGGIAVDWGISLVIARLIVDGGEPLKMNLAIQGTFMVITLLCVWLLGRTPGHWALGIGVIDVRTRGTLARTGPVGLLRALLRTVLVSLVLPAVLMDPDSRGLHDKAAGTVVVRTR